MRLNGLKKKDILLLCFSLCIVIANFYLLFDNAFWTDEVFTINLVHESYVKGIMETAADVHPPLYYLILKTVCLLLGYKGWVYHFASVVAFLGVVALANFGVRRELGQFTAACLVSMCGLSFVGATYNVEVRMYSWAIFFVVVSYFYCYRIMSDNRIKDWVMFTVFALASAYTHYFAMLTVFSMALLLYMRELMVIKKDALKGIAVSVMIAVAGYLPWLVVLLRTFRAVSDDYWIVEYPGWKSCLKWAFGETSISIKLYAFTLLLIFFLVVIRLAWKYLKRLKKVIVIEDLENFDYQLQYVGIGIGTIILTILISMIVSKVNRPVLQLRYLAPMIGIAAICIGITITKCLNIVVIIREKRILNGFIQIVFIAVMSLGLIKSGYKLVLDKYIIQRDNTEVAVKVIRENELDDKLMLVSQARMVLQYYCPEAQMEKYSQEALEEVLQTGEDCVLYLNEGVFDEQCKMLIENAGFAIENFGVMRLAEEVYDVYSLTK